jgi:CAAX prenyl protease-like protein
LEPAENQIQKISREPYFPYAAPFILFLLLTEPARHLPAFAPFFYIGKTILVGLLLWFWRHKYTKDFSSALSFSEVLTSITCGLLVLFIWIAPEGSLFQLDQKNFFDPHGLGSSQTAIFGFLSIRLLGAALVVPVMEELFWRSFLMRYLIKSDFLSVPPGTFTWFSFIGTALFFGLEHHRIIVGIIAGLFYGLLLIYQKNLKGVIIAHGITNLGLGIYVIVTESWAFW